MRRLASVWVRNEYCNFIVQCCPYPSAILLVGLIRVLLRLYLLCRYKVTVFYTAPTAIRALMRCGDHVSAADSHPPDALAHSNANAAASTTAPSVDDEHLFKSAASLVGSLHRTSTIHSLVSPVPLLWPRFPFPSPGLFPPSLPSCTPRLPPSHLWSPCAPSSPNSQWPGRYSLTSLRLLGSVGEPINPEAWR